MMKPPNDTSSKGSVFSRVFGSAEPAPPPVQAPEEHKPAVPDAWVAALNNKIEMLERSMLAQMDKKLAERVSAPPPPPPPPSPKQHNEMYSKVAALEAKIKEFEERDLARARELSETLPPALGRLGKELETLRAQAAATEELARRLDSQGASLVALGVAPLEGRLNSLESNLAKELKERFDVLNSALRDAAGKSRAAHEAATGGALRMEKLEECVAQLPYLENRVGSTEGKIGKIYDLEALGHTLKLVVEKMENNVHTALRESVLISSGHKKTSSDLDSLTRQVKHLEALFNHFRAELAFLLPKKQESSGG